MSKATLATGQEFALDGKRTLLECAKDAGIILGHSCRTGQCGICKAKVLSGATFGTRAEPALTNAEADEGFILTCCRSAREDIVIEAEDLSLYAGYPVKTTPCRIDALVALRDDVLAVTLRTPPGNQIAYRPGQYVDITKAGVRRSYSIASAPRADGRIDLLVRRAPAGELSRYWFDEAKPNDLLYLEGPFGTFGLRGGGVDRLVFLATGTGIAPIKAMLEGEVAAPGATSGKALAIYWGGREPSDFFWQPGSLGLDVAFVPTLSRPCDVWTGATGYVQEAFLSRHGGLADTAVYACGSSAMIASARQALLAAGLLPKNFHSDAFVSSGKEI